MAKPPNMPLRECTFFVPGIPRPQAALRPMLNKNTGKPFNRYNNADTLLPWRARVTALATTFWRGAPSKLAISVAMTFVFVRPQCHFRTGAHHLKLKPSAPPLPSEGQIPDLDHLERAVNDALAGVAFYNDRQVCRHPGKGKTFGPKPGVQIVVREIVE